MSIELKQAAQQALDALTPFSKGNWTRELALNAQIAITALRTAIQQAEAQQPATSEPVAYVCPTVHHAHDGSIEDGPDYLEWADEASDYEKSVGTPLYYHPAPGVSDDVVRDAERYRWLRSLEHCNEAWCFIGSGNANSNLDAAIDDAMLAAKTGGAA